MSSDKHSKTEKPTPKRKKDARRDGSIAKSPELMAWSSMLAASIVGRVTISNAIDFSKTMFDHTGRAIAKPETATAMKLLNEGLVGVFTVVAPLTFTVMAVGLVGNFAQVGWAFSSKPVKPKFSRLNPVAGMKRMMSPQSLWEAGKSALKLIILGYLAWSTIRGIVPELTDQGHMQTIGSLLGVVAKRTSTFVRNASMLGLLLAALDYGMSRRKISKSLMMSKQELKDESRSSEGDPHVKGQIRAAQRRMSRMRMMAEIATADAVVVNPTHVAVALKYDAAKGAPTVVAKGADAVAARIREEAEKHGIPMVEDIPLARTLYKVCEIGDEIPGQLYEAVARMLAFLFAIRATGRIKPVGGGAHRPPQGFLPPEMASTISAGKAR